MASVARRHLWQGQLKIFLFRQQFSETMNPFPTIENSTLNSRNLAEETTAWNTWRVRN